MPVGISVTRGGGGLLYERDGDDRGLAWESQSQIFPSLRVCQYF